MPTTITMYVWADVELIVRVDLPVPPAETTTMLWLRLAVRPEGVDEAESDIEPAYASILPIVISVETWAEPCRTFRVVDPDDILKSTTLMGTCTEWERVPEVAVTVTVKVAGTEDVTVRVAVPEPPPPDSVT